ncbi:hypothetical protein PtB15_11B204 [Puccinia triticina]|nr:hypothetical protein PtB15_11B204 [Puccinia triticina]
MPAQQINTALQWIMAEPDPVEEMLLFLSDSNEEDPPFNTLGSSKDRRRYAKGRLKYPTTASVPSVFCHRNRSISSQVSKHCSQHSVSSSIGGHDQQTHSLSGTRNQSIGASVYPTTFSSTLHPLSEDGSKLNDLQKIINDIQAAMNSISSTSHTLVKPNSSNSLTVLFLQGKNWGEDLWQGSQIDALQAKILAHWTYHLLGHQALYYTLHQGRLDQDLQSRCFR